MLTSSDNVAQISLSINRAPPSSWIIRPAFFHARLFSDPTPMVRSVDSDFVVVVSGDASAIGSGGEPPAAYCCSSFSHRARRSCKSWFGRRRFRAGAGTLGVHVTLAYRRMSMPKDRKYVDTVWPTFTQLEHGVLRSHLILRCWQSTQASTRICLCAAKGVPPDDDMVVRK